MRSSLCLIVSMLALHVHATEPKIAEPVKAKTESVGISANDYSIDLLQLYREAQLEDPRVLAAYARSEIGKENQREAFGSFLPQISANAGANRIKQSNALSEQVYNSENYSVGLSQVIYNKATWENYKKYKSLAKQALSETDEALAEATVDLAQRYFSALAADDELELVQAERRATEKTSIESMRYTKKNTQ